MTHRLLAEGKAFEHWAHAAALMPMEDFRYSLPYKHALRDGQVHWYKDPDRDMMAGVLRRIRAEGPLRSSDFKSGGRKGGGWWDWKPAKQALEQLFMEGALMVASREGGQKTYDLTERVLPAGVDSEAPTLEEFADRLVARHERAHGIFQVKHIAYGRKLAGLKAAVEENVASRLDAGELELVTDDDGSQFLASSTLDLDEPPPVDDRLQILSPFDNAIIQRDRLLELFGFDYRLECFVPRAKRRYGYFCLPLLYAGRFVGRMDCKRHRKERRLEILHFHLEVEDLDLADLAEALADALPDFLVFQECDHVTLADTMDATATELREAFMP